MLSGQAEEIRHIKRQKNELKLQLQKHAKEALDLHEANSKLKEQLRYLKPASSPAEGTTLEKLLASNPAVANEIKAVAQLQRQVIILKKSNNSLRNQRS